MPDSNWQERYDRSIRETDAAIKEANAQRSTAQKIFDRSTLTGTFLDLVIFPFVAVGHAIAALVRQRRSSRGSN